MSNPFSTPIDTSANPLYKSAESKQTQHTETQHGNPLYKKEDVSTQSVKDDSVPGTNKSNMQPGSWKSPIDNFNDVFDTEDEVVDESSETNLESGAKTKNSKSKKSKEPEKLDFMKNLPTEDQVLGSLQNVKFEAKDTQELAEKALTGDAKALTELLTSYTRMGMAKAVSAAMKASAYNMNANLDNLQNSTKQSTQHDLRVATLFGNIITTYPSLNRSGVSNQVKDVITKFVKARGSKPDSKLVSDISAYLKEVYNLKSSNQDTESSSKSEDSDNWLDF